MRTLRKLGLAEHHECDEVVIILVPERSMLRLGRLYRKDTTILTRFYKACMLGNMSWLQQYLSVIIKPTPNSVAAVTNLSRRAHLLLDVALVC